MNWADVVCIGCGLGQSDCSRAILKATMQFCRVPCVIDADGINLLSECCEMLEKASMPVVLTPHMKEMAGLIKCTVSELQEQRLDKLRDFTEQYPVVCALKDSRTIVAERERSFYVNTAGNQGMAKAGSGDVLAGVITGLLAGHLDSYEAAVLGVYLHACGGDLAKEQLGSYSILAEDLIDGLALCLKEAEEEYETI